jgi:uncharacterized protein YlzI (FlbEa/FlbD family)
MICLHRIRGEELWMNPDLIVFVEGTNHDTVITLADGNRVLVQESPPDVSAAVLRFRSTVLAAADELGSFFMLPTGSEIEDAQVVSIKHARDHRHGG